MLTSPHHVPDEGNEREGEEDHGRLCVMLGRVVYCSSGIGNREMVLYPTLEISLEMGDGEVSNK